MEALLFGPYAAAFSLTAVRVGAALRLAPFFGGSRLPAAAWLPLTTAVALALTASAPEGVAVPQGARGWLAAAAVELAVGAAVGGLARLAFAVLDIASNAVELSAFPNAAPDEGDSCAGLSGLFGLVGTCAFLSVGGHHAFLSGLAATLRCRPPAVSLPDLAGTADAALGIFAAAFGAGVLIAMPVFFAGLAADVAVGLLNRFLAGDGQVAVRLSRIAVVELAAVAAVGFTVSGVLGFLERAITAAPFCR